MNLGHLPVFLQDHDFCYSFDLTQYVLAVRHPVAALINVGTHRCPREFHDLDKIGWFLRRSRGHPFQILAEQSCWAFLAGGRKALAVLSLNASTILYILVSWARLSQTKPLNQRFSNRRPDSTSPMMYFE